MKQLIFTMPGAQQLAEDIADQLGLPIGQLKEHIFPDGETLFRVLTPVSDAHIILVARLDNPDAKTLRLFLLAEGFRQQGAETVTLVAPYLPYMRQDIAFHTGEVISAEVFAKLISERFDRLVTVDPHLHRFLSLGDLYDIPAQIASAAAPMANWIKRNASAPIICGPDAESEQWASKIASALDAPFFTLKKVRKGDDEVEISLPNFDFGKAESIVLVDDIVSSGATMLQTIRSIRKASPDLDIICCFVHCLASPETLNQLRGAGAHTIASTNSIMSSVSNIDVASEITELLAPIGASSS